MQTLSGHWIDHGSWQENLLSEHEAVSGVSAGDRVTYSDECYENLRGKLATVRGFGADGTMWTQTDGENGCTSVPAEFALRSIVQ